MIKKLCLAIVLAVGALRSAGQRVNDTFTVYFDLDVAEISHSERDRVDELLYYDKIKPGVPISIIGFTDYLATDEYNLELSQRRAMNVKDYLVRQGMDEKQIKLLIGKGEVRRNDTLSRQGNREDRKVMIVMEYMPSPKKTLRGADTVVNMQPWKKKLPPPTTADPDFDINEIEVGRTFILKNIYFPMGRHFPKKESDSELLKLLTALTENPGIKIQIEGHVCCITNAPDAYDLDSHELDLSINRARFIYEYLLARGIAKYRLHYIGYGKSKPIVQDEQTAEEAAINRRVEIRILER
jgi:outer membrane protein OmpA-like peptidoglycan-associated protein